MAALSNYIVRKKHDDSKIDLTPMLDVVFILLIFFVVTTIPFDETSMPLESQEPQPPDETVLDKPQNILIQLTPDKRVFFNDKPVDISAVRALVLGVLAENPGASVIISPEDGSFANELVKVADAARSAGATDIRVMK